MKQTLLTFLICSLAFATNLHAQTVELKKDRLQPFYVTMSIEELMGRKVVKVIRDSTIKNADQPTFVKISGIEFTNGVIEVTVLSRLVPNASAFARGFIGIAFRIDEKNTKFESIYIRPVNGRADNQLQRNHAIQYFSYPDYDFARFRKEAPGEYESYADMGLNEWIKLKIEVNGAKAKLYINDNKQPSLIVNDLKLGANGSGSIGLWVDGGTEGYFSDVKIKKE